MTMKQKYKIAFKHWIWIQTSRGAASPDLYCKQYVNELPLSINCKFPWCMNGLYSRFYVEYK